jgi:hypothetical protein
MNDGLILYKKEEGRRKNEEAIKSMVSAINNVLTVEVAIVFLVVFTKKGQGPKS